MILLWSQECVSELRIIMVTIKQGGTMWQVKIAKALGCCFHAVNSVILARLLLLLEFYHCDVVLPEIVLIIAGLLEWLDYFSQCVVNCLIICLGLKLGCLVRHNLFCLLLCKHFHMTCWKEPLADLFFCMCMWKFCMRRSFFCSTYLKI